MKNFTTWASDMGLEIPEVPVKEDRNQVGSSPAYPDAYYRSQYPPLYQASHDPSIAVDLQGVDELKKKKKKKD